MFDDQVAATIREERASDGYQYPDYGRYCFAGVPATLGGFLGVDLPGTPLPDRVVDGVDGVAGTAPDDRSDYDRVLHVLVDGFGYEQWRREVDAGRAPRLVERLSDAGRVTPLTSIYPSETAAAITTVHTGRAPAEHGVLGWDLYLPDADLVLQSLPFVDKAGASATDRVDPAAVVGAAPIYERLAAAGIDPVTVQSETAATGPYSDVALAGADRRAYDDGDLDGFGRVLGKALADSDPGTYCYAYAAAVDTAGHAAGTESATYRDALADVDAALSTALAAVPDAVAEDTLVAVTADHGHVNTDPETNVALDDHEFLTDRLARFQTDGPDGDAGDPIPPVGGARNVHLHLQPGTEAATVDYLEATFDGVAFTREAAIERGLFGGGDPSDRFRKRCGDVVFVHRDAAAWRGDEPEKLAYVGWHGGLTPAEMLTPLALAPLAEVL